MATVIIFYIPRKINAKADLETLGANVSSGGFSMKNPLFMGRARYRIPDKKEQKKAFASIIGTECNDLFRLIHHTT